LKCCGKDIKQFETLFLYDTIDLTSRCVYIGCCPNCGAKIVEYIYYDASKRHYNRHRPKRKDVEKFLREIKTNPYLTVSKDFKRGSKSNMNWYYQRNGNIYDFNEVLQKV
jgi:hypothetical protein